MICDIQTGITLPIVLKAKEPVEVIEGIHQTIIKESKKPLWHKLLKSSELTKHSAALHISYLVSCL